MSSTQEPDFQLSEYELLRLERMKRNEERIASLGLTSWAAQFKDIAKKTKRNAKRAKAHAIKKGDERRSGRINKKDSGDNLVMLAYNTPDDRVELAVKQDNYFKGDASIPSSAFHTIQGATGAEKFSPSTSFRQVSRRISLEQADFTLTEEEKKFLSQRTMGSGVLNKFDEFLVDHNKISEQNRRNVMRQVTKLANGEGIRYDSPKYGWKPDQFFMKGQKITLLSDFVELMDKGQECEDCWGRDHGNGWLLSHPLKKLLLFQQFCLENPDYLSSECRLNEYYAINKEEKGNEEEGKVIPSAVSVESGGDSGEENPVDEDLVVDDKKPAARSGKQRAKSQHEVVDLSGSGRPTKKAKTEPGMIGSRVAKELDGEVYLGTVAKHFSLKRWWRIKYDDGDEEDLSTRDTNNALDLYGKVGEALEKK